MCISKMSFKIAFIVISRSIEVSWKPLDEVTNNVEIKEESWCMVEELREELSGMSKYFCLLIFKSVSCKIKIRGTETYRKFKCVHKLIL